MNEQFISDILHGRKRATLSFAARLREAIGISPAWLLWGEGPESAAEAATLLGPIREQLLRATEAMVPDDQAEETYQESEEKIGKLEGAVAEYIAAYGHRRHPIRFPLVGRVSANPRPNVLWDAIDPPEEVEVPPGAVCLEVQGDSMRPVAMPGQKVIALEGTVKDGDLAAVELRDGSQFFKRAWWAEGGAKLILESVRREEIEPPLILSAKRVRRLWRVLGVLF